MNRQLLESKARALLWLCGAPADDGRARRMVDAVVDAMLWTAEECARLGDAAEKRYAEVCSKLGRCESGQPSGSDIAREIRAAFGLAEPGASEERRRMELESEHPAAKFKLPDSHDTACGSRIGAACDCFLGRSGGSAS